MINSIEKPNQSNTDSEKSTLEQQIEETDQEIDQLVYELYDLKDEEEEIQVVEQNNERKS